MTPVPFRYRLLLTQVAVAAVVGTACRWGEWGWGGMVSAAVAVAAAVVWGAWAVARYVDAQHGRVIRTLKSLRTTAETGEAGLTISGERTADSFGEIADELDLTCRKVADEVTELRERTRRLERSETLFHSILGTMIEGVVVLDGRQRMLFCNDAARRLLNFEERDYLGRPIWEVVRNTEFETLLESVELTSREFRKELKLRRNRAVVEITAASLPSEPTPGTVLVLHDVTELRKLERMRREFVSNVSHELKTPLTSIQAYADTLLDSAVDDPASTRKFVERILEQTDRLQNLIQDMLRLARIESQSEAFRMEPLSVVDLLRVSVESRQEVARARSLRLGISRADKPLFVAADRSGLQTVFDNLITNALTYTPEGGQVDVRCYGDGGDVVIEVEDNGVGIASEHQERIFERFYRIDRARNRGAGGTGLGLAIVKHLVTVFGGEVELESRLGQGSLFRVRLPQVPQPAQLAQALQ